MKQKILGLFLVMIGLAFMSCPNPTLGKKAITLLTIPGVTAPELGQAPTLTIETEQYSGTVSWSPADVPFAAMTTYTANIVLTAKSGWTLNGVSENSFKVAGVSAANTANSGAITAVFPETENGYASANIGVLKYVPAGNFQRDGTAANVSTISTAFRMGKREITRAQFLAIMGADPSDTAYSSGMTDPVQYVNWYHAIAFCNKLSLAEGLTPVYVVSGVSDWAGLAYASIPIVTDANWSAATAVWANNGYRLPTQTEWMWAMMGAPVDGQGSGINTTGYSKDFAGSTGSNALVDYAWCDENYTGTTHPVGTKAANEQGLYDMSGNVAEWLWDSSGSFPAGPLTDYRPASGTTRVLRGGTWKDAASLCSIDFWVSGGPSLRGNSVGFRVMRP